jgi:cytochrome c oxidase subunit 3
MELARRGSRRGNAADAKRWLIVTEALGIAFLASQYIAWRQLAAQGVFLPSNPHSSFFYILTGAHGLHLLGGLVALAVAATRTSRDDSTRTLLHRTTLCATYWHFFAVLWLMLFVVLFVL